MCLFFPVRTQGNCKLHLRDIVLWSFIYAVVYFVFIDKLYAVLQMFTFLGIPILAQYNRERQVERYEMVLLYLLSGSPFLIGLIKLSLHRNISIIF